MTTLEKALKLMAPALREVAVRTESAHDCEALRDAAVVASISRKVLHDCTAALEAAVKMYGQKGGPWNVPGDRGKWLDAARAALAEANMGNGKEGAK